jgi:hypothetical protein
MAEPAAGTLFKAEYERELEQWLRRRFAWLLGSLIAYELLSLLFAIAGLILFRLNGDALPIPPDAGPEAAARMAAARDDAPAVLSLVILATILVLAVAARAFTTVRPRLETREQTLQATNWLMLQIGAITFAADLASQLVFAEGDGLRAGAASGLTSILFFHLLPSVFLPWSPRESLRPMYPLVSMFILEMVVLKVAGLVGAGAIVGALLGVPLVLAPGLALCWWRLRTHRRRFDRRMVAKGFFAMRRELSQARAVQMALFPRPVRSPELEFDYAYAPANEVGGDFIHASVDAKGRLDVVMLDVTGHGLASALTVARLSGEIERLLAEDPDIAPGAVLRALNRYVALTLAKHSVYLTAVAVQADPATGEVRYVNAGHPPAWLRRGDGRVERLDSTTFLLGVMPDADFCADETTLLLGPDDALVLVTDGIHEASDRASRQFGLERIAECLASAPAGGAAPALAAAVEQWTGGKGDDDVLAASIRVPQARAPLPPTRSRAEDLESEMATGGAAR